MTIKKFFLFHFVLFLMLIGLGLTSAPASAAVATTGSTQTLADVKTGVISQLQKDGYLSDKLASEAAQKYITPQDAKTRITISAEGANSNSVNNANTNSSSTTTSQTAIGNIISNNTSAPSLSEDVSWARFVSWTNFFKTFGVILLLVAFSGFIKKIIKSMWHLIVAVPAIVYQSVFLIAFLAGIVYPEKIWASQYFYVALFSAFGLLMVISWITAIYPQVQAVVEKLFNFGVPVATVASFWLMIYFGVLALVYQSQIFGFFAAIALSGIFSFTLLYTPGTLFLYFRENALASVVWGHILVLVGYVVFYYSGLATAQLTYFNAGIQYYCATALGVGLLVGASPWYHTRRGYGAPFYALLFIMVFAASTVAYFLGFTTMATIIMCFFALFFLEWIGYVGFKAHWILGCALVGALVFGLGMTMESYAPMIMTNLKAVL